MVNYAVSTWDAELFQILAAQRARRPVEQRLLGSMAACKNTRVVRAGPLGEPVDWEAALRIERANHAGRIVRELRIKRVLRIERALCIERSILAQRIERAKHIQVLQGFVGSR